MADDVNNLGDAVVSTGSTPTSGQVVVASSAVVQPQGSQFSLSGGAAGRLSICPREFTPAVVRWWRNRVVPNCSTSRLVGESSAVYDSFQLRYRDCSIVFR